MYLLSFGKSSKAEIETEKKVNSFSKIIAKRMRCEMLQNGSITARF
jgi:hypothetical protein